MRVSRVVKCLPVLLFTGCKFRREDLLSTYGTATFVLFGLAVVGVFVLHTVSKTRWMESCRLRLRKVLPPICMLGVVGAFLPAYIGVRGEGQERLWLFLAVILGVMFTSVLRWSQTEKKSKQELWLKVTVISISFLFAMAYLANGAQGLF